MKIGIIAPEFLPAIGGMEYHAAGLADAFALNNDVTVFTKEEYAGVEYGGRYAVRPILAERAIPNMQRLKHEEFDRWLTLNASYSWLSRHVDAPVFAYCHGNDFLKPWTDTLIKPEWTLVNSLGRLPYCWRFQVPLERKLKRSRIASGLAGAKMIFVNSRNTQEVLSAVFPTVHTPVIVSWPGVSDVFFETPRSTPSFSGRTLRLLTVARLCHTKNIESVLRALALIKGEIDFFYTVIGDGDLRIELECLAEKLEVQRQTQFLGALAATDVVTALDASDLLLLPSLGESFGIAYAEAAARGVPSLASKTGGAMDAVVEGINGIIVDGPKPRQIAEGIRRFSQTRRPLDREEIQRFAAQFRRSTIAAELRDVVLSAT